MKNRSFTHFLGTDFFCFPFLDFKRPIKSHAQVIDNIEDDVSICKMMNFRITDNAIRFCFSGQKNPLKGENWKPNEKKSKIRKKCVQIGKREVGKKLILTKKIIDLIIWLAISLTNNACCIHTHSEATIILKITMWFLTIIAISFNRRFC